MKIGQAKGSPQTLDELYGVLANSPPSGKNNVKIQTTSVKRGKKIEGDEVEEVEE